LRELSLNPEAVGQLGQMIGAMFCIQRHMASMQHFELSLLFDESLIDVQVLFEE